MPAIQASFYEAMPSVELAYDNGSIDSDALVHLSVNWWMAPPPLFPPLGVEVIDLTFDNKEVDLLQRKKKQKAALQLARKKISVHGYSALAANKSRKATIRLYREIERLGCHRKYGHQYNTRSMSCMCICDAKHAIEG